jgi:putative ABC transport system ATP-binding protein/lipoprotein-releasing system ATP-binding protein
MAQIVLDHVTKTYRVDSSSHNAVNNATLTVEKGEYVSIVGHSGSGKTTLLSIIGGLTRPTSGRVVFEAVDILTLDSDRLSEYRAAQVGFIFQMATLMPMLTVRENLLLPVIFNTVGRPHINEVHLASELLDRVGLAHKAQAYPHQLSGGQQRRVAIARAFMNSPSLILADEPTGDLDEETEASMMQFFESMNRERGITFIIVTHSTELARQTDRQMRMHNGVLLEVRAPVL